MLFANKVKEEAADIEESDESLRTDNPPFRAEMLDHSQTSGHV